MEIENEIIYNKKDNDTILLELSLKEEETSKSIVNNNNIIISNSKQNIANKLVVNKSIKNNLYNKTNTDIKVQNSSNSDFLSSLTNQGSENSLIINKNTKTKFNYLHEKRSAPTNFNNLEEKHFNKQERFNNFLKKLYFHPNNDIANGCHNNNNDYLNVNDIFNNNNCTINNPSSNKVLSLPQVEFIEPKVLETLKEIEVCISENNMDMLNLMFNSEQNSTIGICPRCESVIIMGKDSLRCYDISNSQFEVDFETKIAHSKSCFNIDKPYEIFSNEFTLDNFLDLYTSHLKDPNHKNCSGRVFILNFEHNHQINPPNELNELNDMMIDLNTCNDNDYYNTPSSNYSLLCEDCSFGPKEFTY